MSHWHFELWFRWFMAKRAFKFWLRWKFLWFFQFWYYMATSSFFRKIQREIKK